MGGNEEAFPQTLNMTNRWKKTSEDVQAISAPKVIPPNVDFLHPPVIERSQKCPIST